VTLFQVFNAWYAMLASLVQRAGSIMLAMVLTTRHLKLLKCFQPGSAKHASEIVLWFVVHERELDARNNAT
jgi:hypothetical protein